MGKKASKSEMLQRESQILDFIRDGVRPRDFYPTMAREWKCSEKAIERQHLLVLKDYKKRIDEHKDVVFSTLEIQLSEAYKMAKNSGNIKNMIDATKEQAKLSGMYDKVVEDKNKMPEFIEVEEADFSGMQLVGDKAETE